MASPDSAAKFIQRRASAQAAERANYALFLSELCDLLELPHPDPATDDTARNAYVFERAVTFQHRGTAKATTGRIDLYKRGCFVLEAKQYSTVKAETETLSLDLPEDAPKSPKIARGTAAWDRAMLEAYGQAERYARSLPNEEDPPPFLILVDVGHVIELYADFTQKGKNYVAFPDSRSHRIKLTDLANADIRERLRLIWTTPAALDPGKRSAAVTREVAGYLAELAKSFERHHDSKLVAEFLSRCLFCMFAEDVGLLPKDGFKQLLESIKGDPGAFVPMMELLFEDMNQGRFSGLLKKKLLHFNGGLFASAKALPVNGSQLGLLRRAASLEWRHVEPAIFGTLLERALSPDERHKLGAHYTPRAYVERLVLPTVIEPLREEWSAVRIAAVTLAARGDLKAARAEVHRFHQQLCHTRVLDPACGSGNFLYVAMEQMKRLEGDVITLLRDFGETDLLNLQGVTVDPHQFLGIELNPRAAALAELVLWIGYLQWHFRVHGDSQPAEPVLRKFNNVENRDAVLAFDGTPKPITVEMAEFTPKLPGVYREVLNIARSSYNGYFCEWKENADGTLSRLPVMAYDNPRPAVWPQAEFIVGNPPFIGNKRMRDDLGSGYVETLREIYPNVLEGADLVMFWWHKAAEATRSGSCRRFGFITTNSIRQESNRRVIQSHIGPLPADAAGKFPLLELRAAIPDHPWVENAEGAAVRIAMTVATVKKPDATGELLSVVSEKSGEDGEVKVQIFSHTGHIHPDLTIGAELGSMPALRSNSDMSFMGVSLIGQGFLVTSASAKEKEFIRPFIIGRDLNQPPEKKLVIDFFGLSSEEARHKAPTLYDQVLATVKPERDQNNRAGYREKWWLYGEQRSGMRKGTTGLSRFIVTCRTAKHRLFTFVDGVTIPESTIIVVSTEDAFHLGVLSSCIHVIYSLAAGGRLGVGNDPRYNNSLCFDPFPFPECTEKQKERIRKLAEELDAHRKRAQATHGLGLTDIYNVLEKIRKVERVDPNALNAPDHALRSTRATPEALTAKERAIHDAALVSTLKQLHDDLDTAVADAYGWPWPLSDAEILERVVALNAARAAEEAQGIIRWLRPDYQKPLFAGDKQAHLGLTDSAAPAKSGGKQQPKAPGPKSKASRKTAWPKTIAERAKALEAALAAAERPLTTAELTSQFTRAKESEVAEILATLIAFGQAREADLKGTYVR